jgi:hypothetical protein
VRAVQIVASTPSVLVTSSDAAGRRCFSLALASHVEPVEDVGPWTPGADEAILEM